MKILVLILILLNIAAMHQTTVVRDTYTCTPPETWPFAEYGSHPVCYEV